MSGIKDFSLVGTGAGAFVANRFRARLDAGELAILMSIRGGRTPEVPFLVSAAGCHALYVDLQHSSMSLEQCSTLCIASIGAGVTAMVRVPDLNAAMIAQVLDGGAAGVILPDVDTEEQARAIVDAVKFPPIGKRSVSGSGVLSRFAPVPLKDASDLYNRHTMVIAMIESAVGLENVDGIAATPGIDAIFVGSNDLSSDLGVAGDYLSPVMQDAYARVLKACENGPHVLIGGTRDAKQIKTLISAGAANAIVLADDTKHFAAGLGVAVRNAKNMLGTADIENFERK